MPYSRTNIPRDHSEFGGGPGLVDPVVRKDRVGLETEPHQYLREIYATAPHDPESIPEESPIGTDPARPYITRPEATREGTN